MLRIHCEDLGKRYRRDWIFRHLQYSFEAGSQTAITGPNGIGKSTLLQVICGFMRPSSGQLSYFMEDTAVSPERLHRSVSWASPAMELQDELTLLEQLRFHGKFRNWLPGLDAQQVLELTQLQEHRNKALKLFSSGMRQRVKLALALLTASNLCLLDEPGTNLDHKALDWYLELVNQYAGNRTFLVASNQADDFSFCKVHLNLLDYKPG